MDKIISDLMRAHYRTLQGYVSAGMESDKSAEKIFLNANENPYELPGLEGFNRYPEPQPHMLRAGYGELYGVDAQRIVMTRGADEAIAVLVKLFCEPEQDKIVISSPTFGMYGVNGRAMPAEVMDVPLLHDGQIYALDVDGLCAATADKGVKLIFMCSPNNPTGNVFAREDIEAVIEAARGNAIVVLDETYIEFSQEESFTTQIQTMPHIVILRTLSKSYSMAGMRMGSMICGDVALADLVRSKGLDAYPLPRASVDAAMHVMRPDIQDIAKENILKILDERMRVEDALRASDEVEHVYPSDTNFLLVKMKRPEALMAACAEHDIVLRDFSTKPGTEGCLRISIGTPAQNDRVLDILARI